MDAKSIVQLIFRKIKMENVKNQWYILQEIRNVKRTMKWWKDFAFQNVLKDGERKDSGVRNPE